jgi:hypothetical protein
MRALRSHKTRRTLTLECGLRPQRAIPVSGDERSAVLASVLAVGGVYFAAQSEVGGCVMQIGRVPVVLEEPPASVVELRCRTTVVTNMFSPLREKWTTIY